MRLPALPVAFVLVLLSSPLFAQPADPLGIGEDDEMVPGHRVILKNGKTFEGLVDNVDGTGLFLVVKKVTGNVNCPRDEVARVESLQVHARQVYTPEERYRMHRENFTPKSADDHVQLSRWCVRIRAYAHAVEHAGLAVELLDGKGDELAKKLQEHAQRRRITVEAYEGDREVRRLFSAGKYDAALSKLTALREKLADEPYLQGLHRFYELERMIRGTKISPAYGGLMQRFRRVLDSCVKQKLLEPGLTWKKALRWSAAPDGLAREFYAELARELKLTGEDAERLWALRPLGQYLRIRYGSGVLFHPDSKAPRDKLAGQVELTTPDGWWAGADSAAKLKLLAAWFAEYSGLLEVRKTVSVPCRLCGSPGIHVTSSAVSGNEVRTECPDCRGVGHDRHVLCQ